ncbi:MAG: ribose-5-phosphate isomerase RpiA [Caldilineaceae bacterium]
MPQETALQKQHAAHHAATYVHSGMVLGLGTGATATIFVERLGELLQAGQLENIVGIPTSSTIAEVARRHAIPLTSLEEHPVIDLTVDGADEVDPHFNLIKGGGGALLREKIVAQASKREVIIVDEGKLSPTLGTQWHVPVEVVTFGWRTQFDFLVGLGAAVTMRETQNGMPFVTDQGNYILDANFGLIPDPGALAAQLCARVGIVEHGLFVNLAHEVIVGQNDGVRILPHP